MSRDTSLFVPVHVGLRSGMKLRRLRRRLDVSQPLLVGHLVSLWLEVITSRPDGVLHGWDAAAVEEAAEWDGSPGALCEALIEFGWLDDGPPMAIHEWAQYGGRLEAERERKRSLSRDSSQRHRDRHRPSCDGHSVSHDAEKTSVTHRRGEESIGEERINAPCQPDDPRPYGPAPPPAREEAASGDASDGPVALFGFPVPARVVVMAWCITVAKLRGVAVHWLDVLEQERHVLMTMAGFADGVEILEVHMDKLRAGRANAHGGAPSSWLRTAMKGGNAGPEPLEAPVVPPHIIVPTFIKEGRQP